jgi:holo-[acyl-carrier protein] synthase
MIVGIGVDLVEIERIRAIHQRHGDRFVKRILTPAEAAYVLEHKDPAQRLSGRWAAKEAALKALGTGLAEGLSWRDLEILPDERGKPVLQLFGKARERAALLQAGRCHITITHSEGLALAQVILERL